MAQPLVERECLAFAGVGQDDAELLAAVAPGQVAAPQFLAQQACEQLQRVVALGVAMGIVDVLEMVDVEHDHHQRMPVAAGVGQLGLGPLGPGTAVEQAGEVVGDGLCVQFALGLLAVGHQDGDGRQHQREVAHQRGHLVDRVRRGQEGVGGGEEGAQDAAPEGHGRGGAHAQPDQCAPAPARRGAVPADSEHDRQHLCPQHAVGQSDTPRVAVEPDAIAEGHQHRQGPHRPGPLRTSGPQADRPPEQHEAGGHPRHRQHRAHLVLPLLAPEGRQHEEEPSARLQQGRQHGLPRGRSHAPAHDGGQRQ